MDLVILHAMQAFREGYGAFLNTFLNQMTSLGDKNVIPVLLAATYWCVSKDIGTYLLFGFHWNRLVNGFAKVTVCAYRPWIRDPSLIPDATALPGATGYSFPSGHSMNAATFFGGIGVNNQLRKNLRTVGWIVMALIGFSRIYMCVHTPQDVLVGLLLGCMVMFGTCKILPLIESAKNGDLIAAILSLVLAVCIAVYAAVKSYPVDYDATGKILVDGSKMAVDTYKAVGWNCGFFVGWIIERRYVKFTSEGTISNRCLRLIVGLLSYYFINLAILPIIQNVIGGIPGTIINCFLQMLYIVLLCPICFKLYQEKTGKV